MGSLDALTASKAPCVMMMSMFPSQTAGNAIANRFGRTNGGKSDDLKEDSWLDHFVFGES